MIVHNTIASILAALAVPGVRRAVLLAKSDQRIHYRRAWHQLTQHFVVPSLVMDDKGEPMIVTGNPMPPVVHFIAYSKLSRPDSTRLLAELNPDLIIADEVHSLASVTSSRSLRWLRFMSSRPGIKFAGWSGTLLDKSIRNMAHLSAHALGYGSPMPINPNDVEAWASVLDPSPQPDRTSSIARGIFRAFGDSRSVPDDVAMLGIALPKVRDGFQRRLSRTPGVITSMSTSSASSITVHERKLTVPAPVAEALKSVRGWKRPDGEELVEAVEQARTARECGTGYFYYWIFGDEPRELIEEWFEKRRSFNCELRERILNGEEYLDSRFLCERAAARYRQVPPYEGDLPVWKSVHWPAWEAIRDKVKHTQGVEWIDPFFVNDAAAWAREHRGIVWTLSNALGRRIAEVAGINYHGGGPDAEKYNHAETGKQSIVASIKAHGEGRDQLQYRFSRQLIAEMPSGAKTINQLLGRLCRRGQPEDEVLTWVYLHHYEARDALRKAVRGAEFVEQMTPSQSLLLAADFTFEV